MAGSLRPSILEPAASLVTLRREIHRRPELRFEERRTAALVEARLRESGYDVRSGVGGTGVVADQQAPLPGPHVVIRADMDALPVSDRKDVPYASEIPGVAHACGHDVHTTVVLGVAERMAETAIPRGRVTFAFQPAEERPFGEPSGAQAMLDAGFLDDTVPDAILGLHCWPDLRAGSIGIDERVAMAAKDAFRVRLIGRGAHAAVPSRGRDAILGIAQLVTALHQGFARSVDPGDLAVLNIGTLSGGSSQSVIADHAEATGTLRTVDPIVRARLRGAIERIAAAAASILELGCEFTWADEMPAIVNDPGLTRLAHAVSAELVGAENTRTLTQPPMTSDDFALFSLRGPALYLKLGVCRDGGCPPLHSGSFDVDERAIGVGVGVLHALTLRLLAEPTWRQRPG